MNSISSTKRDLLSVSISSRSDSELSPPKNPGDHKDQKIHRGSIHKINDSLLMGFHLEEGDQFGVDKKRKLYQKRVPSQFLNSEGRRSSILDFKPSPKQKNISIFKLQSAEGLQIKTRSRHRSKPTSAFANQNNIQKDSLSNEGSPQTPERFPESELAANSRMPDNLSSLIGSPQIRSQKSRLLPKSMSSSASKRVRTQTTFRRKRKPTRRGKRKCASVNLAATLKKQKTKKAKEQDKHSTGKMSDIVSSFSFDSEEERLDDSVFLTERQIHSDVFLNKVSKYLQKIRFRVSSSNPVLQVWKGSIIALSFLSAFQYAYTGSFLDRFDDANYRYQMGYDIFYSAIFFFDMLSHILIQEQTEDGEAKKKEFSLLLQLFFDLLTVFPFFHVARAFSEDKSVEWLKFIFLIKILRLYHGFAIFDFKNVSKHLKQLQVSKFQRQFDQKTSQFSLSEQNSVLFRSYNAPEKRQQSLNISRIFFVREILRTLELLIIVVCISYMGGLLWFIISDISNRIQVKDWIEEQNQQPDLTDMSTMDHPHDCFIMSFGLDEQTTSKLTLSLMYFAFTTLSTVGLGDYHPRSNSERVFGAFFMLFGVLITSVVMDNFNSMLTKLRELNSQHQEYNDLYKFIFTVQRYNNDEPIEGLSTQVFIEFFQNRWQYDKNLAICTGSEQAIFQKIPDEIERRMFEEFMFRDIRTRFASAFEVPVIIPLKRKYVLTRMPSQVTERESESKVKIESINQRFILDILKHLEPQFYRAGRVIMFQNSECDSMVFPLDFEVKVGFNYKNVIQKFKKQITQQLTRQGTIQTGKVGEKVIMNQMGNFFTHLQREHTMAEKSKLMQYHFPLTSKPGTVIGLFEMLFDTRSLYTYRVESAADGQEKQQGRFKGFYLRKKTWRQILRGLAANNNGWDDFMQKFKDSTILQFFEKIYQPVKDYQDRQESQYNLKEEEKREKMKANIISLLLGKKPNQDKTPSPTDPIACLPLKDTSLEAIAREMESNSLASEYNIRRMVLLIQILRDKKTMAKKEPTMKEKAREMSTRMRVVASAVEPLIWRFEELAQKHKEALYQIEQQNRELDSLRSKIHIAEDLLQQQGDTSKRNQIRLEILEAELRKKTNVTHEAGCQTYLQKFGLPMPIQEDTRDNGFASIPLDKSHLSQFSASPPSKKRSGFTLRATPQFESHSRHIIDEQDDCSWESLSNDSKIFEMQLSRQKLKLARQIPNKILSGFDPNTSFTEKKGSSSEFESINKSISIHQQESMTSKILIMGSEGESSIKVGHRSKMSGLLPIMVNDSFSPPAKPKRQKLSQNLDLTRLKVQNGFGSQCNISERSQKSGHRHRPLKKRFSSKSRSSYKKRIFNQNHSKEIKSRQSNRIGSMAQSESIIEEISINETGDGERWLQPEQSIIEQNTIEEDINVSNLDFQSPEDILIASPELKDVSAPRCMSMSQMQLLNPIKMDELLLSSLPGPLNEKITEESVEN